MQLCERDLGSGPASDQNLRAFLVEGQRHGEGLRSRAMGSQASPVWWVPAGAQCGASGILEFVPGGGGGSGVGWDCPEPQPSWAGPGMEGEAQPGLDGGP